MIQNLFEALGCKNREDEKSLAKNLSIPLAELDYYDKNHILPNSKVLHTICQKLGFKKELIMLKMGVYSSDLINNLADRAELILDNEKGLTKQAKDSCTNIFPDFSTELGQVYNIDCLKLLSKMEDESVDLVFADPPFNLDKFYKSEIDDKLHVKDYYSWTLSWIDECIRVLKPGGSFFIWNLPKWNSRYGNYLHERLNFRHWIAVDIKYRLPIANRLYPSHYSLLYLIKGEKPNTFDPDRMAMSTCPKCFGDLKDYGGYKDKMNSKGINLTDVWLDIPPVRHKKYKKRPDSNELTIKLMDRIIEMSSKPNDLIFDPFGGSGTTFIVAEIKKRRWIGSELEPLDIIKKRFKSINEEKRYLSEIRKNYNQLFPDKIKEIREKNGLWTDSSIKEQYREKGRSNGKPIYQGSIFDNI